MDKSPILSPQNQPQVGLKSREEPAMQN